MQLLYSMLIIAVVVLLGMVLLVPWLRELSWKRDFACPMPTGPPRQTPVGQTPWHRNPAPNASLAPRAATK